MFWWRGVGICQGVRHLPSPDLPGPPSSGPFSSVLGIWGTWGRATGSTHGSCHLSRLCLHFSPWAAPAPSLLGQGHSQTCPYLRRGREPNLPHVEAPRQHRTLFPGVGAEATNTYRCKSSLGTEQRAEWEEFRGVLEKASITTDRQNKCGDSSGQESCRECPSLLRET